jgi:hypothetical protein
MARLLHSISAASRPTGFRSGLGRYLFAAGLCGVVLLFLVDACTISRQAPWQDEIFVVSTGLSVARSEPPIQSVMAQYPRADSPIRFYGPVSFVADAQLIRWFGLSITAWRLACLGGVALTLVFSTMLVRFAGGDNWAQLVTALIIGLAGSFGSLPGRWDAVTSGLFLGALLFLLRDVQAEARAPGWQAVLAGVFVGFTLGSTPRSLTLIAAAMFATLVVAVCFRRTRRSLLFGIATILGVAISVQTLLLLPWGLNPFSWYAYVRQATKDDAINATSVAGHGAFDFNLRYHKTFFLVFLLLLIVGVLAACARRKPLADDERTQARMFLALFATANLVLMLLLLAQALGQSAYWLPPVVIATMCWFDWSLIKTRPWRHAEAAATVACLFVLVFTDTQRLAPLILTWNRRNNTDITAFVRKTLKSNGVVYGPVSGDFYPVELAGARYLYVAENARAGRVSEPGASISDKLEQSICSHPTYAIWPEANPAEQPEQEPMPDVLRERLLPKAGEFKQPPLSPWKEKLLGSLGPVVGKYGFPDTVIYPLRSLNGCARQ